MKKNISLILIVWLLFFGQVLAQAAPSKTSVPSRDYLIKLINYFNSIDGPNITAKDWEDYVKKIYPENNLKIDYPNNLSEKQKKEYLKSIALAMQFAKNGFDLKLPSGVNTVQCLNPSPGEYGSTRGFAENRRIICPNGQTGWVFTVMFHELVHIILNHPISSGGGREQEVDNFINRYVPGLLDKAGAPQDYDIFKKSSSNVTNPKIEDKTSQLKTLFSGEKQVDGLTWYVVETSNLVVYAPTLNPGGQGKRADSQEIATKYAEIIENVLTSYCPKSFGCPLPPSGVKTQVYLHGSKDSFARQSGLDREVPAFAKSEILGGKIIKERIDINLSHPDNEEIAKHETVHIFLHRYFINPIMPAWANEGLAVLSEREDIIQKRLDYLKSSSLKWTAEQVMSMDEIPRGKQNFSGIEIDLFGLGYSHSTSLVRYLSEVVGDASENSATRKLKFINFVKEGQAKGYNVALKKYYGRFGINNQNDLDQKWRSWRGF